MRRNYQLLFSMIGLGYLIWSSIFIVQESEHAIVERLGQVLANRSFGTKCTFKTENVSEEDLDCRPQVLKPGMHFVWPFIDSVKVFDARLMNLLFSLPKVLQTTDKKDVLVDLCLKWKVKDYGLFYIRVGQDQFKAEDLLKQKLNDRLRIIFSQYNLRELISEPNIFSDEMLAKPTFKAKQNNRIMAQLKAEVQASMDAYGINVADVLFKQMYVSKESQEKIFQNTKALHAKLAAGLRAKGKKAVERIMLEANKRKTILLAEAQNKAQIILGECDAAILQAYADTMAKSPEFFDFYQCLHAYNHAFSNKNTLVIFDSENELLKNIKKSKP